MRTRRWWVRERQLCELSVADSYASISPQIDGDSEEDDKTSDFQGKEVGRASYRICSYVDTFAVEQVLTDDVKGKRKAKVGKAT